MKLEAIYDLTDNIHTFYIDGKYVGQINIEQGKLEYIMTIVNGYEGLKEENEKLKEELKESLKNREIENEYRDSANTWYLQCEEYRQQLDKAVKMIEKIIYSQHIHIYDEVEQFLKEVKEG